MRDYLCFEDIEIDVESLEGRDNGNSDYGYQGELFSQDAYENARNTRLIRDIDSRETYLALSRRDTSEKSIESEVETLIEGELFLYEQGTYVKEKESDYAFLYVVLIAVCVLIGVLIATIASKYRRKKRDNNYDYV